MMMSLLIGAHLTVVCGGSEPALAVGEISTAGSGVPQSTAAAYIARLNGMNYFDLNEHIYKKSDHEPLGQGKFAIVYAARRLPDKALAAIKCAFPNQHGTPGTMLANEVSIMKLLRGYPWTLDVLDYHSSPGLFECAAFELGGWTITKNIEMERLTTCRVLDVADRMVTILDELHAFGVVHDDPHAGNWLLTDPEDMSTLKLIDYGKAVYYGHRGSVPPEAMVGDFVLLYFAITESVTLSCDPDHRPCPEMEWVDCPTSEAIRGLITGAREVLGCPTGGDA